MTTLGLSLTLKHVRQRFCTGAIGVQQQRWATVDARNYAGAIQALNSLQSNFAVIDAIRKSGRAMNRLSIPEMIEWLRKAGYEPADLEKLNVIHVAGTKGKGSTSSFISSILQQYQQLDGITPSKIGLYTSPHLRFVRERIQIDGRPLCEADFAKYFFDIWDRLEKAAELEGHDAQPGVRTKPLYFRFLTLMAFHCYVSEGVDAAVVECGLGGEYDSTNIVVRPAVTAVTSLGIDHTAVLGDTIESIAWHKAGIFKPGVPAFTAAQPESALKVLEERARERRTTLQVIRPFDQVKKVKLGLAGDFQYTNASVAVAAAAAFLRQQGHSDLPDLQDPAMPLPQKFVVGLENAQLGGRCETRHDHAADVTWYIDGGHTLESIGLVAAWFSSQVHVPKETPRRPRILIFNQQSRDAAALSRRLYERLTAALKSSQPFTHAIFCANTTFKHGGYRPDLTSINTNDKDVESLNVQNSLASMWEKLDGRTEVAVLGTIEEAVAHARNIATTGKGDGEAVQVLVTGSLHLAGGLIEVLESEKP